MRKGQIAIFAIVTFVLAVLLFSIVMPIFNRVKNDDMSKAYSFLFIPFGLQLVWFGAGAVYSARSKHREMVFGILWGFALEFAALVVLILFSASAHY
jgi:tetrahydromethanopterin S-methyltransferase subunit B